MPELGSNALIALLFGAAAILFIVGVAMGAERRRGRWPSSTSHRPSGASHRDSRPRAAEGGLSNLGYQLRAVMAASFQRRRVLNASEYRVFRVVEREIASARNGFRVFAQTSLGEILQSPSRDAFLSVNSKRADVLVIDRGGWPVLVVEYQGGGHYPGTAAARDAIKKEALRKAGVKYLEISADADDDQIGLRVREQLRLPAAASATPRTTPAMAARSRVPVLH